MNGGRAVPVAQMTFRCLSYKLSSCSTSAACASSARSPSRAPSPPPRRPSPSRSPPCRSRSPRSSARPATILVQRSARGVRLTEAGEALVRHADAVLARLAEAEAELEAIAGLRGGRLRMAAFESAGATLMPLAIARVPRPAPRDRADDDARRARGHRAACSRAASWTWASASARASTQDDGIERHFLLEDPMFLVLPRDHPLAEQAQPAAGRLRRRGVDRRPAETASATA